jgi:hypothetical protein
VTGSGDTATVRTQAGPNGGKASLMSGGQANFAQGQQTDLAGGTASWRNVSTGARAVAVVWQDGSSGGSQTVTVGSSPTASSTTAPMRGVRGGLGDGTEDHSTHTLAAGGAVVAVGGGALYLRRRTARNRL